MRPSRDSRFTRLLLFIFFAFAALYAAYEAQGILFGPQIHVEMTSFSSDEALISIRGRAERISELRLNGATISVTESGEFNEPYLLASGSNRIILEAFDARGRTARETLDIVYRGAALQESVMPTRATSTPQIPVATSSTTITSPQDAL